MTIYHEMPSKMLDPAQTTQSITVYPNKPCFCSTRTHLLAIAVSNQTSGTG
jgi:hypothetical protein